MQSIESIIAASTDQRTLETVRSVGLRAHKGMLRSTSSPVSEVAAGFAQQLKAWSVQAGTCGTCCVSWSSLRCGHALYTSLGFEFGGLDLVALDKSHEAFVEHRCILSKSL